MRNDMPYFYKFSHSFAKSNDELEDWRASFQANIKCARAIENAIARDYDNNCLKSDCAKSVIEEYGFARVNFVLQYNLHGAKHDGRYSQTNKEWAEQYYAPKSNESTELFISSHPVILNGFIDEAREEWNKLGLFDSANCVEGEDGQNYEGKLLIISPNRLADKYKTPEDQLFYATGGFGCYPEKAGRKVFGYFLKDDEHCQWDRSAFLGVIKDECIPEWAAEKLQQHLQPSEPEETSCMQLSQGG